MDMSLKNSERVKDREVFGMLQFMGLQTVRHDLATEQQFVTAASQLSITKSVLVCYIKIIKYHSGLYNRNLFSHSSGS